MKNLQEWMMNKELMDQIKGGNGPAPGEVPDDLAEPPPF